MLVVDDPIDIDDLFPLVDGVRGLGNPVLGPRKISGCGLRIRIQNCQTVRAQPATGNDIACKRRAAGIPDSRARRRIVNLVNTREPRIGTQELTEVARTHL